MSLRDQLASKKPHVTSCTFPIGEAGQKAADEYRDAANRLETIKLLNLRRKAGEEKIDTAAAEAEVARALQAYKDSSVTLRFRGLSPAERDELASDYTPAGDDEKVDLRAYTCALLEKAALDSDLTATDWEHELYESQRWSSGEVDVIRETARAAYQEVTAPGIPKD